MRVITIGNFDGAHLGHIKLIETTAELAKKNKLSSCAVTFERIFSIPKGLILTPINEKLRYLSSFQIDEIITLPSQKCLWEMSPEQFLNKTLFPLSPKKVVVGYNFRFGRDALGDTALLGKILRKRAITLKVIPPVKKNRIIISSSIIRDMLLKGLINEANMLLGRFYAIEGVQRAGDGIASNIGFPTINIEVDSDKLLPRGIFCAIAENGKYEDNCLVYIGTSPTLKKKCALTTEFHLLKKPDGRKVFNKRWRLYIVEKIRDEMLFSETIDLKKQIKKDIIMARSILSPKNHKTNLFREEHYERLY